MAAGVGRRRATHAWDTSKITPAALSCKRRRHPACRSLVWEATPAGTIVERSPALALAAELSAPIPEMGRFGASQRSAGRAMSGPMQPDSGWPSERRKTPRRGEPRRRSSGPLGLPPAAPSARLGAGLARRSTRRLFRPAIGEGRHRVRSPEAAGWSCSSARRTPAGRVPTKVGRQSARPRLVPDRHEHIGNIRDELDKIDLSHVPIVAIHATAGRDRLHRSADNCYYGDIWEEPSMPRLPAVQTGTVSTVSTIPIRDLRSS